MIDAKKIGWTLILLSLVLCSILIYVKMDIDRHGVFLCKAVEANPDMTMEECPVHQSKSSWMILAAFGVAFVILAGGIALIVMRREIEPARRKVDTSKLDEQEKKIVSLLQTNDGSMYQSDLMKEIGVTKVKMTRILDKLEGKKIIDRKRRGMTNIVLLR